MSRESWRSGSRWEGRDDSHWCALLHAWTDQACIRVPPIAIQLSARLVWGGYSEDGPKLPQLSDRHVRRVLHEYGLPPPNMLHSFGRCARTIHMLAFSGHTIERAALESGWSEGSNFSRCCKRLFGLRPRQLQIQSDTDLLNLMMGTHLSVSDIDGSHGAG